MFVPQETDGLSLNLIEKLVQGQNLLPHWYLWALPHPQPLYSLRPQAVFHSFSILRRTTSFQATSSFIDSACVFSFLLLLDTSSSPTCSSRCLAGVGKAVHCRAPFTGLQAVHWDGRRYSHPTALGPVFSASITFLFLTKSKAKRNSWEQMFLWSSREMSTRPMRSYEKSWLQTW